MDPKSSAGETIRERIDRVESVIREACRGAHRNPADVKVIAVTKYLQPDGLSPLLEAGLRVFGENRWQQAKDKVSLPLPAGVEWHFIGHLQKNKVAQVVRHFQWIHSVDSLSLLQAISHAASTQDKVIQCLLQVNVANESSKQGLTPNEVAEIVAVGYQLPNIQLRGLMTMAPRVERSEHTRPVFRNLRTLLDTIRDKADAPEFNQLSMGMSEDYRVAVEEGATMVRIGRVLVAPEVVSPEVGESM